MPDELNMPIIDAHLHFSDIASFHDTASSQSGVDYSAAGLAAEFAACGVIAGVGMGVTEQTAGAFPDHDSPNPMGLDLAPALPDNLYCCIGINPVALAANPASELQHIEAALRDSRTVGIKLYAGYYHYYVDDAVYEPIYNLAAAYQLPVVIHGGLTYSDKGLLKYSHPLAMEEIIVRRRDVTFMICHLGDPWVMDTAAMLEKNPNLYTDLSGWIVGDAAKIARFGGEQTYTDHFRRALVFAERYDKVVFGTDWPLVPIAPYLQFVRDLIPQQWHEHVFYRNALELFPRLKAALG